MESANSVLMVFIVFCCRVMDVFCFLLLAACQGEGVAYFSFTGGHIVRWVWRLVQWPWRDLYVKPIFQQGCFYVRATTLWVFLHLVFSMLCSFFVIKGVECKKYVCLLLFVFKF